MTTAKHSRKHDPIARRASQHASDWHDRSLAARYLAVLTGSRPRPWWNNGSGSRVAAQPGESGRFSLKAR